MKRVIMIVLDSVGAGALPDADKYGDVGANTLGHIWEQAHPDLPYMEKMGLGRIEGLGYPVPEKTAGAFGRAIEVSAGKDTTTGHWEMMGLKLDKAFPTYPNGFPKDVMDEFERRIGRKTLGNYPASGTAILDELGEEHMRTGCPIVYTSGDSVFQIACHEDVIPVEELYRICRIAREMLVGDHAVGRVIARPFTGTGKGHFTRTPRRRDFSLEPTGETLLDVLKAHGVITMGVGKIEDIFCMRGITQSVHSAGNPACLQSLMDDLAGEFTGLCFVNLVDFDMLYGHRNDVDGYANALTEFDVQLRELLPLLRSDDLLFITADHGCDPSTPSTDHSREHVPMLAYGAKVKPGVNIGTRSTYADLAATVAEYLGVKAEIAGESFLKEILK